MSTVRSMPLFDTHKAVKALSHAGFDNTQAEAVVEQINEAVNENVATKNDFERFATKEDLERFATKEDLKLFATKEDLKLLATKEDLERFATKEELKQFATKLDSRTLCRRARQARAPHQREVRQVPRIAAQVRAGPCRVGSRAEQGAGFGRRLERFPGRA